MILLYNAQKKNEVIQSLSTAKALRMSCACVLGTRAQEAHRLENLDNIIGIFRGKIK